MSNIRIVHEADAQRQHVRVRLPALVVIKDKKFRTNDWSVAGVNLQSDANTILLQKGKIYNAELKFMFDAFKLNIPIQLEVMHIDDKGVGCRFSTLDEDQLSILQVMVSSYVSGEVVDGGDIIDVVARHNMTKARNVPSQKDELSTAQNVTRKLSVLVRAALVVAASFFLIFYIIAGVYERLYVVKAASAMVTAELISMEAPASGNIYYKLHNIDKNVVKGEALFTVTTESDKLIGADSPCNCVVKKRLKNNRDQVTKGQNVIQLADLDSIPYIEAYVTYKDAINLAPGKKANLSFAGNNEDITGTIEIIQSGDTPGAFSKIIILTDERLPVSLIDDPVEVSVDTLNLLGD